MNVVFDLGAIVFTWEPAQLLQQHLPAHAPDAQSGAALARSMFHHADWKAFDGGVRSLDHTLERLAARLTLPMAPLQDMLGTLGERLAPIPETVALLEQLFAQRDAGADLRIYYLSNMPAPYARDLERLHGFMQRFDGGVFSGDVKYIKPDREIYELMEVRYGLVPEDTVFIDDVPANVEAARGSGWHAIHCTHPPSLPTQLARYVTIDPIGR